MGTRLELQAKFEELLGVKHVYYNSPGTMTYPAIRYTRSSDDTRYADDLKYSKMKQYDVVVITREPDPEVVEKILELPYSSIGRPYVTNNLFHYPITLYY